MMLINNRITFGNEATILAKDSANTVIERKNFLLEHNEQKYYIVVMMIQKLTLISKKDSCGKMRKNFDFITKVFSGFFI